MYIRQIVLENIRNFRDKRIISFVNPETGRPWDYLVLAGSNGCGKTTILQAISNSIDYVVNQQETPLLLEIFAEGFFGIELEVSDFEIDTMQIESWRTGKLHTEPYLLRIVLCNEKYKNHDFLNTDIPKFEAISLDSQNRSVGPGSAILKLLLAMSEIRVGGGILTFPANRQFERRKIQRIEKPSNSKKWIMDYQSAPNAKDNIEQYLVWQNYLDLEANTPGKNLQPSVSLVENCLGNNRKITIKEGEVLVDVDWTDQQGLHGKVRIDQLPSGEQQILLLLIEIIRRKRPGIILLIDEVENSLHPTYQRMLTWNLRRLAKELHGQVIVTTHSLEVIHSVKGGSFINLDYPDNHFDREINDEGKEVVA